MMAARQTMSRGRRAASNRPWARNTPEMNSDQPSTTDMNAAQRQSSFHSGTLASAHGRILARPNKIAPAARPAATVPIDRHRIA